MRLEASSQLSSGFRDLRAEFLERIFGSQSEMGMYKTIEDQIYSSDEE